MGENKTIWAFDLGTGSIGEALRDGTKFLHKADLRNSGSFGENKMGAAKAPVPELQLTASLLSSRQFGILATAGFDLALIIINPQKDVNCGIHA